MPNSPRACLPSLPSELHHAYKLEPYNPFSVISLRRGRSGREVQTRPAALQHLPPTHHLRPTRRQARLVPPTRRAQGRHSPRHLQHHRRRLLCWQQLIIPRLREQRRRRSLEMDLQHHRPSQRLGHERTAGPA